MEQQQEFKNITISEEELLNITGEGPTVSERTPPPEGTPPPPSSSTFSAPPPVEPVPVNIGSLFDASLAVTFLDSAVSTLLPVGMNYAGYKSKKSDFAASTKEKESLTPIMQKVMDQMQVKISNPFEALFWGIVAVYGPRAAVVAMTAEKVEKRTPEAKETNETKEAREGRPVMRRHTGKPDCKCAKCSNRYE
jgi:hypothetical protein